MRQTFKHVLTEYGKVALVLYLAIFALVLCGTWIAIRAGWSPTSAGGKAGTFFAAYIVTKAMQPLRIAATVVLTPLLAKGWERMRAAARRPTPGA
jgi:hypothetical protein